MTSSAPGRPGSRRRNTTNPTCWNAVCRRADGVYRWWLIHGVPLRGANGEIQKWLGTCTNIEE